MIDQASSTRSMSDFPAAYLTERSIGFSFPDMDREALQAFCDEDFAMLAIVLLECILGFV